MTLLKLSNLLLLHIISQIDDNADTVCLLLTCKRIYSNGSIRRLIQFKGIRAINTDKGQISEPFKATAIQFRINSFNDILLNSVSDQYVILDRCKGFLERFNNYPHWIRQRITSTTADRVDKSNITTALLIDYQPSSIQLLYDNIPSIETLFIHKDTYDIIIEVDLGSIALLPNLERLSLVGVNHVILGRHTSLKSLKLQINTPYTLADLGLDKLVSLTELSFKSHFVSSMAPEDQLPIGLTSLTLRLNKTPPRDAFHSLRSLVKLKIILQNASSLPFPEEVEEEEEVVVVVPEQPLINLEHLPNLNTFKLDDNTKKLDEVINHTNVRHLTIIYDATGMVIPYYFSLTRLDSDNRNVLVLEKQSLSGGIITQRIITNQQQQQQTQYDPILLHFYPIYSKSPYELKWSFAKDTYNF
ncbi:hypothetical protein DFA_06514 [Cavenderia fasciculata]|uniref:Uncharacterized protein n=1 Tax=Cavenderia fasciculata TaxID=261658 RepID=F4PJ78_CACFS|nr:uncharacterized protein DFA_06514 [Cavenderia fasciculata]EGG24364.1 hypothetical protein DFA_06514 [Cavenderia fasciculata]|eukprot:XP_004362215.1 hypothetical protein DFA_06514 [Cavenderia fasciculata]